MAKKIEIRLHYISGCSGSCCCGPDKNMVEFEGIAERLVKKFGEEGLQFEAYNAIDAKKFPFLKDAKSPAVSVGKKVISSGKLPPYSEIEKEISSLTKVA